MKELMTSLGTPEASELVLCQDSRLVCETYIFEPTSAEVGLGRLYAVGETEDRQGIGKELLDMTIQALQREYYRDPTRPPTASFESALHQANLVLHDAADQGVRDWMGCWHVAVAVVADATLHISTAGEAAIFLLRRGKATLLTQDLSYSPITDPLRAFSQVASGALAARDVLFLGTAQFSSVFRREDLARFAVEHSAQTISTRLAQLHADQQSNVPLAQLTVSILPRHIVPRRQTLIADATMPAARRQQRLSTALLPRQPLVIHRTAMRAALALMARIVTVLWRWITQQAWPLLVHESVVASRNVQSVTKQGMNRWQTHRQKQGTPWPAIRHWLITLPRTSKIFAGVALALGVILLASILLLQSKRADDAAIQQASEKLHAAQTKLSAAETALIYDNRDQARALLEESVADAEALVQQDIYVQEAQQLLAAIVVMQDRLQKVTRASTADTRVVGDFGAALGKQPAGGLTFIDGRLFSFNQETNEIFAMTETGETSVVSATSQGIGSLRLAVPHHADKNIVFVTDAPGIAILDTKTGALREQDISLPDDQSEIVSAAVFGSRLYTVQKDPDAVYSYNKTLRGYSGRTNWLVTQDFPIASIVSLAVDGSIYTLQSNGSLHELFKGETVDFAAESVDPPLAGSRKIITYEGFKNIYVLDPNKQRVVIFAKTGVLGRQIVVDVAASLIDIAVSDDEATLYILDGTRVLALPLGTQ